jgi:hypothetical protein
MHRGGDLSTLPTECRGARVYMQYRRDAPTQLDLFLDNPLLVGEGRAMATYWIGIAGEPTPDQEVRLADGGLTYKGICGEAFSRTIYDTYYLSEGESEEQAVARVSDALPELREVWEKTPPHVMRIGRP